MRRAALVLVKAFRVISCITVLVTGACSSEPPTGSYSPSPSPSSRNRDPQSEVLPDEPASDDPLPLVDAPMDASAPPDATADAAPAPDPKPAPVGAACQTVDTKEIRGEVTPFTKSACGDLGTSADEDFFTLSIPTARTIVLTFGAQGDAVARLQTPNGNVIVVSNGATASVGSASGTAIIRVRSNSGTPQDYRIVAD